jgi:hypothetical protein
MNVTKKVVYDKNLTLTDKGIYFFLNNTPNIYFTDSRYITKHNLDYNHEQVMESLSRLIERNYISRVYNKDRFGEIICFYVLADYLDRRFINTGHKRKFGGIIHKQVMKSKTLHNLIKNRKKELLF